MKTACCGFGHRELYRDIKKDLQQAIEKLVEQKGISVFYTGNMGEFDSLFINAVNECKRKTEKEIRLVLVLPYLTKELNKNKEYYEETFDEIIIPEICEAAHYKQAITRRNEWMIEQSQIVLSAVYRDFGGAFTALQYAVKCDKDIIDMCFQK